VRLEVATINKGDHARSLLLSLHTRMNNNVHISLPTLGRVVDGVAHYLGDNPYCFTPFLSSEHLRTVLNSDIPAQEVPIHGVIP